MQDDRVFDKEYLATAGVLTVDLIEQSLQLENTADAALLVNRLQQEIFTMYYSYEEWEKAILRELTELGGEEKGRQALVSIEDKSVAPERIIEFEGLIDRWTQQFNRIKAALESSDFETVRSHTASLYQNALAVHDGMMSRVTALLSILYEEYGDDVLAKVLQTVMRPELMDPDGKLPFKEKVEKIMHFSRVHLQPFRVVEDDEKVTFLPDPCPSGGRLMLEGYYDPPRNGAYVTKPGALTYGRDNLPIYCCHEPAMELSSIEKTGAPVFIVDPAKDIGKTLCKIHVYKDRKNIPEKYYKRLGLDRPDDLIAISNR